MFIFNLWYACVILYICTRTNCKKLCIFTIFLHLHYRFTIFLHLDSSSVAVLGSSDENSLRYLLCPSDENSSRYFLGSSDENSLRYFLGPKQLTLFLGLKWWKQRVYSGPPPPPPPPKWPTQVLNHPQDPCKQLYWLIWSIRRSKQGNGGGCIVFSCSRNYGPPCTVYIY